MEELKPISMTLCLVDMSIKVPQGNNRGVLIQVGKFIYPMDFIVLNIEEREENNLIPIILGKPFLATFNALINCRNGHMCNT